MEFKWGCGIVSAGDHREINRIIMEFKCNYYWKSEYRL